MVIIGAGFAGLAAANEMGGKDIDVTLIDRRNYHLFVPLLYQVASAALSPADIAEPIRRIVSHHPKATATRGSSTARLAPRRPAARSARMARAVTPTARIQNQRANPSS